MSSVYQGPSCNFQETSFTSGTEQTPWSEGSRQDAEPQAVSRPPFKFFMLSCALRTLACKAMLLGLQVHTTPFHPAPQAPQFWLLIFLQFLNQVMTLDLMYLLPKTLSPRLLFILPFWPIITF